MSLNKNLAFALLIALFSSLGLKHTGETSSYIQGKNQIIANMYINYDNLKYFVHGDG